MYGFHYKRGVSIMSETENPGKLRLGFLKNAFLAWSITIAVLLPLLSFLLVHFSATERTMGYVSSALSFLAAAAAGARAARGQKIAPLLAW